MRLLVVGTVPVEPGTVYSGLVSRAGDGAIAVGEDVLPGCQGTTAMLLAAEAVTSRCACGVELFALLGGDVGRGEGTRAVFSALDREVDRADPDVLAFHYMQPIMALMRRAVASLADRTEDGLRLVADAGGMYAARASGVGDRFELMTPDVGEVGFLADQAASHPAYVSHYLFGTDGFDPVRLAREAQSKAASARVLLVKGETDHVVEEGRVTGTVEAPLVPALEAIGGTGDTLTGIAAGLMACGEDTAGAALVAARVNREAGRRLDARPDHHPADLVARLPEAFDAVGDGAAVIHSPMS